MKKHVTRLMAILLAGTMCIGLAACGEAKETDGGQEQTASQPKCTFVLNEDKESYTLTEIVNAQELTIPSSYEGLPVTAIGANANIVKGNPNAVKKVTIPASVTTIGGYAFSGCGYLEELVFEENSKLVSIGRSAFEGCHRLTKVPLPEGVVVIQASAFQNCFALKDISLPEGVVEIQSGAFRDCSALENISLPDSVMYIRADAFAGTKYREIEGNWKSLSQGADAKTKGLFIGNHLIEVKYSGSDSCVVPDGTKCIADSAFVYRNGDSSAASDNSYLTSVTIPPSVVSIGDSAFEKCNELETLVFGDYKHSALKSIGTAQVRGKVETVRLPLGIEEIGAYAFDESVYHEIDGVYYLGDTIENKYPYACGVVDPAAKEVTLSSDTKVITDQAFSNYKQLTNVVLPEGLVSIGRAAFSGSKALTAISIPASVKSIGAMAFRNCDALTSVTFATKEGWKKAASKLMIDAQACTDFSDPANAAAVLKDAKNESIWWKLFA